MFHSFPLQSIFLNLQLLIDFTQATLAIYANGFSSHSNYFIDQTDLFRSTTILGVFLLVLFLLEFSVFSDKQFSNYFPVLCIPSASWLCTKYQLLLSLEKLYEVAGSPGENMPKDVAYTRVSSREQALGTNALDQQRARVKDAGAEEIFEDIQQGKSNKRPAYKKLLEHVESGKIRKIIITRIDRIARSIDTLKKLIGILNKHGVELEILDQKMDLGTAQGKMVLNILGALAEWEVDLLSERVEQGKKYQRQMRWANPPRPWGYEVVDHKYVLDQTPFLCLLSERPDNYLEPSQIDDRVAFPSHTIAELARDSIDIFFATKGVRRALKVIFAKYGIVKTSAKFNGTDKVFHWSARGFSLWLRNPVLDGHTRYLTYETIDSKRKYFPEEQQEMIRNTHPEQRLFKDGEADAAKIIIEANIRNGAGCFKRGSNDSVNYRRFSYQTGLVYCAECGSKCTSKGAGGENEEYLYYACRHVGVGCGNRKSVKRRHIEESLIEALVEKSQSLNQDSSALVSSPSTNTEALAYLEAQLAGLEQVPGYNPDVEQLKAKLRQQIEEEQNPFLSVDKVQDKPTEALIRVGNNLAIWHLLNNDEKVEIYRKLVKKIYIRDGKVVSVIFNQ